MVQWRPLHRFSERAACAAATNTHANILATNTNTSTKYSCDAGQTRNKRDNITRSDRLAPRAYPTKFPSIFCACRAHVRALQAAVAPRAVNQPVKVERGGHADVRLRGARRALPREHGLRVVRRAVLHGRRERRGERERRHLRVDRAACTWLVKTCASARAHSRARARTQMTRVCAAGRGGGHGTHRSRGSRGRAPGRTAPRPRCWTGLGSGGPSATRCTA